MTDGPAAQRFILIFSTLIFIIATIVAMRDPLLHSDESAHFDQIRQFAQGHFAIDAEITTIPGYNLLMAVPALLIRRPPSIGVVRLLNCFIGLLGIAAFYRSAKILAPQFSIIRTLQFAFFPLLFPFFFLIFTDVLSLTLILFAFCFTLKKRWGIAGIFAIASAGVRQDNIIWIAFLILPAVFEAGWKHPRWKRIWPLISGCFLIAIFLFPRHSLVLGDQKLHPASINPGNIYLFLCISFTLFFPFQWEHAPKLLGIIQKKKWLWIAIPLCYAAAVFTFHVDHPYNTGNMFFLRNRGLMLIENCVGVRVVFFIFAAAGLGTFLIVKPLTRIYWSLLIFSALFLMPMWLIEQRYYLIPLALFSLMRPSVSARAELALLGMNILLSLFFFTGIFSNRFFL